MALPKILSCDEFMAWLERQPEKYEYWGGRVRRLIVASENGPMAMAGGAERHNVIEGNVVTALRTRLRGGECRTFTSNQLVKNVEWDEAFFPDASVFCGAMEKVPHGTLEAGANPRLVVEILAPTTEGHDRRHKLFAYQAMPSVKEIVLIQAVKSIVERYVRVEGGWRFEATVGLGATARIFGYDVPMAELYEDAEPPEETEE